MKRTALNRKPHAWKRSPLKRQSAKRRKANRARFTTTLAAVRQRSGGKCELRLPGCQGIAVDMHERLSRAQGGSITDPDNIRHACRACHDRAHCNPREARRLGIVLSGHRKISRRAA